MDISSLCALQIARMTLLKSLINGMDKAFYELWKIFIELKFYCPAIVTFTFLCSFHF